MNESAQESYNAYARLFYKLIEDAPQRLYHYVQAERITVYFSAPAIVIDFFIRASASVLGVNPQNNFAGIEIVPSTDWAITLFHKDYPVYKEDWMIHKIALTVPQKTIHNPGQANEYEKLIIHVTDMFQFLPKENPELN